MNYLQRTKRPANPFTRLFGGILFTAAGVGILIQLFAPSFFPGVLHGLGGALWRGSAASISSFDFFAYLDSKETLIRENQELKRKLSKAELRLAALPLLQEEYAKLQFLAGRESEKQFTLAAVLVRPNVSLYDTLVVDAGRAKGVASGDRVTIEGIPIGTVERVYQGTSVVRLFSTPGETTLVQLGEEKVQVSAESRGGGNFEARLPRDIAIALGDEVSIPGIPASLFAIVEQIVVEPSDPFQVILFKSPADPYTIQYVEIRKFKEEPL